MKRWSLLLALFLCLFLSAASAEVRTRQTDAAIANGGTVITTFDTELPDDLAAALQANGYAAECLCGVDWHSASRFAWVVQQQENGRNVIALNKWPSGDWQVASLGSRLLPAEGGFTLDCDGWSPSMLLQAPLSDGGTENFTFQPSGDKTQTYWRMTEYRANHPDGSGEHIYYENAPAAEDGLRYRFVVETTNAGGEAHRAGYRWLTDGLADDFDFATFPRTQEQLAAATEASWAGLTDSDIGCCLGCNLRAEPSTNAKILGYYNGYTLLRILEEVPGEKDAWFRVRIGDVEGYMFSRYVWRSSNEAFLRNEYPPLYVGETVRSTPFLSSPYGEMTQSFEAGMRFHVMGQTDDGWLHVMLPRDGLHWLMDMDGTSGYVRQSAVALAFAESLLPSLAAEQ